MCWFLEITLVSELKPGLKEGRRERFIKELETLSVNKSICLDSDQKSVEEQVLAGEHPIFRIGDWHCSCDFVSNNGRHINPALRVIKSTLKIENLKRVELQWWLQNGITKPIITKEEKVTMQQLQELSQKRKLEPECRYRVSAYS